MRETRPVRENKAVDDPERAGYLPARRRPASPRPEQAEAADDARRSLALARGGDHPVAEALALVVLSLVACVGGDRVGAVQLARQAERISAGLRVPVRLDRALRRGRHGVGRSG